MKSFFVILMLASLSFTSFSQKVKINDNIATVDGEVYLKIERFSLGTDVSMQGINADEEEISAMYYEYNDPNKITNGNPNGRVSWIEINFLTLNKKCEVSSRTNKGLVKLLYRSNIYTDGRLNPDNVDKFVRKYGMKFTENRPKNGDVNIIINN